MAPSGDAATGPLIPDTIFDAPSQRLYVLSGAALLQALKIWDLFTLSDPSTNSQLLLKWSLYDMLYISVLPFLRIPRLNFTWKARVAQILFFIGLNFLIFGNYSIVLGQFVPPALRSLFNTLNIFGYDEVAIAERRIKLNDVVESGSHLLGQHTVRLSPISTAKINPYAERFCLALPQMTVLIPILLNNTRLNFITYSVAPLGDQGPRQYVNVTSRELRSILATMEQEVDARSAISDEAYSDELEEEEYNRPRAISSPSKPPLQKTQSLSWIRINRPGVIRLERALDTSDAIIRLYQTETTVVECPTAEFLSDEIPYTQCIGATHDLSLKIKGTAPMSLKWRRQIGKKKDEFLVEGIQGDLREADRLPLSQEVHVPLPIQLNALGTHQYTLDTLSDGVGNILDLTIPSKQRGEISRTLKVLPRSSANFRRCSIDKPINILEGRTTPLRIALNNVDPDDAPWVVTVKYQPVEGTKSRGAWTKDITVSDVKAPIELTAEEPGEFTIIGVRGKYCSGDVMSPETCRVVQPPRPTADIEYKAIHECSGDVGVAVSLVLHGTPPFEVTYSTQRNSVNPVMLHKNFTSARGEITLQPDHSGQYIYNFIEISDANYKGQRLDGPTITQIVHPVASADFGRATRERIVSSCSGSSVPIYLDLRGIPPWNVELQIVDPKGSHTLRRESLKDASERLMIPIPEDIDQRGGTFQVDLVSVEDANGCKRSLSVPGVNVDVRRVKPTARFYAQDGHRQVTILEGDVARLPLRLTGNGPWDVEYRLMSNPSQILTSHVSSANALLSVKRGGIYELLEIHDSACPGNVVLGEETYKVDWVQRPTVAFSPSAGRKGEKGLVTRPPVCEGVEDHAELEMRGTPPFQISYISEGGPRISDQATFSSIQSHARLHMKTSVAGHYFYQITRIGDLSYPSSSSSSYLASRVEGVALEQDVLPRPSAHFKSSTRMSYCLNDAFISRHPSSDEGVLALHGTPPFVVNLSIKSFASSEVQTHTVTVDNREWKVNIPDYVFNIVGPHQITIDSVTDAANCPPAEPDIARQTLWVDVAETAAIVPFERRNEYCVGEVIHFQLEGSSPWHVRYRFNGKISSVTSKSSKFSRAGAVPGIFEVLSVAHQQNMCETTVSDTKLEIHAIPSARVNHGEPIVENIREGEQAEIKFTLEGEPPFTFTYQRTELPTGKRPPKVAETHTVSGLMTREYTVLSALEGTWTVTSISDKYCRYPPAPSDGQVERA